MSPGVDIVSQLLLDASRKTVQASISRSAPPDTDSLVTCFETLLALADEHINNVDYHVVSARWLSLYVDVNILFALHDLSMSTHQGRVDTACRDRCVRKLDMAIVIGGAAMPKRMEWIQRAIKYAQVDLCAERSPRRFSPIDETPRKRRRLECTPDRLFAPNTVPTLSEPPNIESYVQNHCNAPFVLRGHLTRSEESNWPALARWSDTEYLISRVGHGRCVPVEEGSSYDDDNWSQRIVPFEDFLTRAGFSFSSTGADPPNDRPMYLAQHTLLRQFPELAEDMRLPDYVLSRPAATADFPSYRPPSTKDGVVVNVWVGSGSGEIVSPAHTVSRRLNNC